MPIGAIPEGLARRARLAWAARRIAADRETAGRLRELGRAAEHADDSGRTVMLRLAPLRGRPVAVRPGTADVDTVWSTFMRGHHLPPPGVEPRLIWDLGCNVGLTMAHLATLYPEATVVGVELDARNAELARLNVGPWGSRCRVVHAAVWPGDGEVWYHRWPGATSGYRVADRELQPSREGPMVPALSLDSLLAAGGGPDRTIDYVKIDVEGAERELLRRNTGWAASVRSLKVEVHEPYTVDECLADVEAVGFGAERDGRHPACVVGLRAR
jgi:FkbM family methyltransferase